MYLANDVIQNSKKKGPEFGKEFGGVLKKAFEHMSSIGYDEKTKGSLVRVLNIWGERGVYDQKQIAEFKQAFGEFAEMWLRFKLKIHDPVCFQKAVRNLRVKSPNQTTPRRRRSQKVHQFPTRNAKTRKEMKSPLR